MSYLTLIPAQSFDAAPVNWSDGDELHRTVMRLFPNDLASSDGRDKRATAGILFRVERGERPAILVRSSVEPVRLPRHAICRTIPDQLAPSAGTRVAFRCTVNAVHQSRKSGSSRYIPTDDVARWFSARTGVALADIDITDRVEHTATQKNAPLRLTALDGFATVADPEALDVLMQVGIGRAKAYGAALLTIARA